MEGYMINDVAVRLDLLKKRKRGAKFKYEEIKFYNDFFDSYAEECISFIPLESAIPTSLVLVWKKHIKFSAIAKAFKDIIN